MTLASGFLVTMPLQVWCSEDGAGVNLENQVKHLRHEVNELRALLKTQSKRNQPNNTRTDDRVLKEVSKSNSEWNKAESIVHLAGYGAIGYTDSDNDVEAIDTVTFNPIFHYQYRDLLMLEAELEVALDDDGDADIGIEYATIDILLSDYATLVAGKFMSPLGFFRQNLHPAWINKLPSAPSGFGHDGAAPTANVGVELRGGLSTGTDGRINYAVFVGNGPELELEEEDGEFAIEAVGTEGFTRDSDGNKVFGGRVGWLPLPRLELGVSVAGGDISLPSESDREYQVLGFDFAYQWNDLGLRAEYIHQDVGSKASSIAPNGGKWKAWYAQAAYRILQSKWEAVLRYSDYDSPHASQAQEQSAVGINYLFSSSAMVKTAYEFNHSKNGSNNDTDRFLIQLAYGF